MLVSRSRICNRCLSSDRVRALNTHNFTRSPHLFPLSVIVKLTKSILPIAMDQPVEAKMPLTLPPNTANRDGKLSVTQRRKAARARKANNEIENVTEATSKLAVCYHEPKFPYLLSVC